MRVWRRADFTAYGAGGSGQEAERKAAQPSAVAAKTPSTAGAASPPRQKKRKEKERISSRAYLYRRVGVIKR